MTCHCGGRMVPDRTAIVPAMGCEKCGRQVPRTGVRHSKVQKRDLNRALRAAVRARQR